MAAPLFKVSNRLTQDVDFSKERKKQMRNQIRFWKWRTASGQVVLENQDSYKCIYTQLDEV